MIVPQSHPSAQASPAPRRRKALVATLVALLALVLVAPLLRGGGLDNLALNSVAILFGNFVIRVKGNRPPLFWKQQGDTPNTADYVN